MLEHVRFPVPDKMAVAASAGLRENTCRYTHRYKDVPAGVAGVRDRLRLQIEVQYMTDPAAHKKIGELTPPMRLMMTPGPSSIDPRVYRALGAPIVGHIDPWFKTCMDETQILLRQVFQTENRVTMPLSASGSGGIEASVLNTLEEGDDRK